jgi:hypothetical protein
MTLPGFDGLVNIVSVIDTQFQRPFQSKLQVSSNSRKSMGMNAKQTRPSLLGAMASDFGV